MIILIPMAGKGERFVKKGYGVPKPLIDVGGKAMVLRAVHDLPKADKYFFVVLTEHMKLQRIESEIKADIPNAEFIILNEVTAGQASTCLAAMPYLDQNDELLIGACDNGMIFNKPMFASATEVTDVLVFTFRQNVTVVEKPNQYGWVKVDENNNVIGVSVKIPISDKPINDHAIVGAFWFKHASIFKTAAERMIVQNRRVNTEFYIDECINDVIALGYNVKIFEVDKYICWGTPNDYETFNYWRQFFHNKDLFI